MSKVQLDEQRRKQVREAEELLFAGRKNLVSQRAFSWPFVADWVVPYPKWRRMSEKSRASLIEIRHFWTSTLTRGDRSQGGHPEGSHQRAGEIGGFGMLLR